MNLPRKWMALKHTTETLPPAEGQAPGKPGGRAAVCRRRVGGREGRGEADGRPEVERPLVQILVVVANIQVKSSA